MSAPEGSSGKGGGAFSFVKHQLAVDDDVGHADRQLSAGVVSGAIGNLLRIKDTHVCRHAFSQQPPIRPFVMRKSNIWFRWLPGALLDHFFAGGPLLDLARIASVPRSTIAALGPAFFTCSQINSMAR